MCEAPASMYYDDKEKKVKEKKKLFGRNPLNEDLAANRARYGRGGYEKSKRAYNRKDREGRSKRQRWSDYDDEK